MTRETKKGLVPNGTLQVAGLAGFYNEYLSCEASRVHG